MLQGQQGLVTRYSVPVNSAFAGNSAAARDAYKIPRSAFPQLQSHAFRPADAGKSIGYGMGFRE
jgi:hypothetical protein